jgi:tellurite methyltransferase
MDRDPDHPDERAVARPDERPDERPIDRPIVGFHQDEVGDWVAELGCGHGQHVRHRPPFWNRPWVQTDEGRTEKLGALLPCVLCARFELPAGHVAYQQTRELDQDTVPDALRKDHTTKAGVWGVIHVLEGRLRYVVEEPLAREMVLEPGIRGIVVPEIPHRVEPEGPVRFYVELYRRGPG